MKRTLITITLLLLSVAVFAQKHERKVTAVEAEFAIGTYNSFATLTLEGRYNFRSPWDVGFRACSEYCFTAGSGNSPVTYDIVGDYNFRRGKNISLFVGAGAGVTTYDDYTTESGRNAMFHFMPRAGVELFNRVRLTAYANTYANKEQSGGVGLSAGLVLGGSRVENKEWNTYHFEVEPHFGIATRGAILFGLETRYNFNKPWDVGLNVAFDLNGTRITAVGDYEFMRKQKATLFCGMCAGWANTSILNIDEALDKYGDSCLASTESCFCFYPRVGVELWKRLRLTMAANTYNFKKAEAVITMGVAIGGGNR